MERAEMRRLLDWKSSPQRKPLLLFGARQVGKSYLIEQFARENYEKYALFNLEEDPRLTRAFDGNLDPCTVISNCMMIYYIKFILRYLMRYRPKRRLTVKVTTDTIAIFIRYG